MKSKKTCTTPSSTTGNDRPARPRARAGALAAIALLLAAAPSPCADAADPPAAVVEKLTNEVIAVLQQKQLSSAAKRAKIEPIVYDYVDFDTMSRLVLARNWSGLAEAQQKQFVEEFKKHLSITYGSSVDSYRDEKVSIVGSRQEARGDWTVQTRIVRDGPHDILVDYRLRQIGGEWKIIDVVIERVSLVSSFRSQFQDMLSNGGIERVLKVLREKNAAGQPLKG